MRAILVCALALCCSGCATVIRGTTGNVGFNSSPSGAEVHTSNGLGCVTPCTLTMKKNEEFIVTFTKPGFIPQQVEVKREIVGGGVAATAGNVILGGLIGIGVDAATGAGYDHVPNPVSVILQPEAPPPPPPVPPVARPHRKPLPAAPRAAPAPSAGL